MIIKLIINALALFAAAYLLKPRVKIDDIWSAVIAALVIGLLNATLGQILDFFAFPFTAITFGLFSLVVDAVLIKIADYALKGFEVKNFLWAIILAACLAIINAILYSIFL